MKKGNLEIVVAVTTLIVALMLTSFELIRYVLALKEVSMPVTGKMYNYL